MSKDMHQYDRNMVIDKVDENGIKWFDPADKPFEVSGLNWFEQDKLYQHRFHRTPRSYILFPQSLF